METGTLAERLKEAFDGLAGVKNDGFLVMTEKARVVVTMDRLLDLFGGECDRQGCNKVKEVQQKCEGGVVVLDIVGSGSLQMCYARRVEGKEFM